MKDLILRIIICAISVSLLVTLSPDNNKNLINGLGSILFLMLLISPLRSFSEVDFLEYSEALFQKSENYLQDENTMAMQKDLLKAYLEEQLKAMGYDAEIELDTTEDKVRSSAITLNQIYDDAELKEMLHFISYQTGCGYDMIFFQIR